MHPFLQPVVDHWPLVALAFSVPCVGAFLVRAFERPHLLDEIKRACSAEGWWRANYMSLQSRAKAERLKRKANHERDWADDDLDTRVLPDKRPTMLMPATVLDRAQKSGVRIVDDQVFFAKKDRVRSSGK